AARACFVRASMIGYDQSRVTSRGERTPMRRTIYLPDVLAERVEAYLWEHPGLSLSTLVREALEHRLVPPDPGAILDLAGLVPEARSTLAHSLSDPPACRAKRA